MVRIKEINGKRHFIKKETSGLLILCPSSMQVAPRSTYTQIVLKRPVIVFSIRYDIRAY
jgi:hypothetical protein